METISWQDFEKVELRVGTVVEVADFPEARKPAYKVTVDFGPEIGLKKSSAQIRAVASRDMVTIRDDGVRKALAEETRLDEVVREGLGGTG